MRRPIHQTLAALAALAAVAPSSAQAQQNGGTTWAVVVGINDYINLDEDTGDLRGAENDAISFHEVLVDKMGVPPEQIRILLSREATGAAIEEALTVWLRERARADDRVFFFYAGHGSQTLDEDGDESDGLDETIGPADASMTTAENDILDDELQVWFEALEASEIIVILDSCNSGTATRFGGVYAQPRRLERTRAARQPGLQAGEFTLMNQESDQAGRILEVAAAAPGQSAMDAAFRDETGNLDFFGGAFTTHLVRTLWLAPPNATFRDVFRRARSTLKADRFVQDPQYTAAADLPVFRATPSRAASVEPEVLAVNPDGTVRVALGEAGAFGANSILETEGGGLLRVTRLRSYDVLAAVVREPVRVGDAVRSAGHLIPGRRLKVATQDLAGSELASLRATIDGSDDIDWLTADQMDQADIVVARGAEGRFVVFGRDGLAREAPPPSGGENQLTWIARRLEWELAVQRLASLASASTRYAVEVTMNRTDGLYQEGDPIEITVESELEGHLTLIEIGAAGAITVLLPNRFSGPLPIRRGQSVTVPGPSLDFLFEAAPPFGLAFVQAIVTPEPLTLPPVDENLSTSDAVGVATQIVDQVSGQSRGMGAADIRIVGAQGDVLGNRAWGAGMVSYKVVRPGG